MSWGQSFRLRHMATGMFLGVTERKSRVDDEDDMGGPMSLGGPGKTKRRKQQPHQLTIVGSDGATREKTAFSFSRANVS